MSNPVNINILVFAPTSEEREFSQSKLPNPQLNCVIKYDDKSFFYDKCKIELSNEDFEIVLVSPEKAGPLEAYNYLKTQLEIWAPDMLIVVGVAGGYSLRNVKIGDLILPLQITEFALFKDKVDGQEPRPEYFIVSKELVHAAKRFFDSNKEVIQSECNFNNVSCYSDGTILSSVALQAKEATEKEAISKLLDADGKIYGIEQESSGIARLMDEHKEIKWMIIRVVMDLADEATRSSPDKDQNKKEATKLATQFCFKFLDWYLKKVMVINDERIQNIVDFLNKIESLDIQSTSFDEHNYLQTKIYTIKRESKVFNMEGRCNYRNSVIRLFIDINKSINQIELEQEYKVFLKDCFSIWVNENIDHDWIARFIFVSDHPFFCSKQFELKNSITFLNQVLIEFDKDLLKFLEEFETRIEQNFLPLLNVIFHTKDNFLILK